MSTLVSSFVKDRASADQLSTLAVLKGAAKAWIVVQQSATPATISSSWGVTTITDTGVGTTTANWSISFTYGPTCVATNAGASMITAVSLNQIITWDANVKAAADFWPQVAWFGNIA